MTTLVGPYTGLGWSWMTIGSGLLHLVPASRGPLSRTACHRSPIDGARRPLFSPSAEGVCTLCLKANRGVL